MRQSRHQRRKIDHELAGPSLARLRTQLLAVLNQQFMYSKKPVHRKISRLFDHALYFVDTLRDSLDSIACRQISAEAASTLYYPHFYHETQFEKELLTGVPIKMAEEFRARAQKRQDAFYDLGKFISFDSDDRRTAATFLFSCRNTIIDVRYQATACLPNRQANKIKTTANAAIKALFRLSLAIERCHLCR